MQRFSNGIEVWVVVNILESRPSIRGTGEDYLGAALGCAKKAKADPCAGWDNPRQQHRLRKEPKVAGEPVNVECGQRARELGLPRGLRARLTTACNCNCLMGGENKSNQALCTLEIRGNKHYF